MSKVHHYQQQKLSVNSFANRGITIIKGSGAYLYDDEGKKYLDFMSNFGVNVLGHSLPEVIDPIKSQLDSLLNLHGSFNNDTRSETLQLLMQQVKALGLKSLSRIFWTNSGAEAIEAALKFAYLHTGRSKFLATRNAYHGKTLAALGATSSNSGKYQKPFKELLLNFTHIDYGDLAALEKEITDEYAAFIVEPLQGEGGIIVPPADYLAAVSKLCKKHDVLVIIDEIQTGQCRTGSYLAVADTIKADSDFTCDILCLGKGLAAGIPVGATLVTEEVNSSIKAGLHTSTFGGNPLAMAGVKATLSYLKTHEIAESVAKFGAELMTQLRRLQGEFPTIIKDVRGKGLLIGVECDCEVQPLLKSLQSKGLLAISAGDNVIRLLPPLVIGQAEINFAVKMLREVLSDV